MGCEMSNKSLKISHKTSRKFWYARIQQPYPSETLEVWNALSSPFSALRESLIQCLRNVLQRLHLRKVALVVMGRERVPRIINASVSHCAEVALVVWSCPWPISRGHSWHGVERSFQSLQKFGRVFFLADIQRGMFFCSGYEEVDISLTAMTDCRGSKTASCPVWDNQYVYEIVYSIITTRNERGSWLGAGIYKADTMICSVKYRFNELCDLWDVRGKRSIQGSFWSLLRQVMSLINLNIKSHFVDFFCRSV